MVRKPNMNKISLVYILRDTTVVEVIIDLGPF